MEEDTAIEKIGSDRRKDKKGEREANSLLQILEFGLSTTTILLLLLLLLGLLE